MNWIIETIFVHLLFLGSIFVIYFRSPVIQGLHPQSDLLNPPAKRLVLFVLDGLRAESFFDDNCTHIPRIRDMFLAKGLVGISHTRVPTESRPGHIALIAGLYEDPTAVTKGWRENPIDFDSVFNRSKKTYAWGSNDVLSIFSKADYDKKMEFLAYDHALDFSGKDKTYQLDKWVFSNARDYITRNSDNLKKETKVVFFLHLLGLDTAGHVHKPGSPLFLENLRVTDNGIAEMYEFFNDIFDDGETAYVLTSDHGMTDKGSHGAGNIFETQTPLYVWGAGVHDWYSLQNMADSRFKSRDIAGRKMASLDVEQADISPLMAALIGTAMPMNNYGKLPWFILKVAKDYQAKAMFNNMLQVLTQYGKLFKGFQKGALSKFLPSFEKLSESTVGKLKAEVEDNIKSGNYGNAIYQCENAIDFAIEGIEYYQMYYQRPLLFCTAVSFLGWICHLLLFLQKGCNGYSFRPVKVYTGMMISGFVLAAFIYLQSIPYTVGVYFLLPLYCWARVIGSNDIGSLMRLLCTNWKSLLGLAFVTELMVLTFFKREVISVAFLGLILYQNATFKVIATSESAKYHYYEWLSTSLPIIVFPLIPLGYLKKNDFLLMFGGLLWIIKLCLSVKYEKSAKVLQLLSFIGFTNCLLCLYFANTDSGLFNTNILLSWAISGMALVLPVFSNQGLQYRTSSIFFYFAIPYFHLSIGYEMIFFSLLGLHILSFVELNLVSKHFLPKAVRRSDSKDGSNFVDNFNIPIAMLLLIFVSFFGTGNMASISSFDPAFARFFVTTFSPFTMTGLIILKLVIPIVIIVSAVRSLTFRMKMDETKVFLSLLLICELMGFNFLFMVTNKGSWLEIGTSISHFVIMEVTTLILATVNYLSNILLFIDLSKTFRFKRVKNI